MPTECCVPLCTNKGGHAFPWSKSDKMKVWIAAVKRETTWAPTRHSVVCKEHFDSCDYVDQTTSGTTPLQRRLKPEAYPHIFPWKKPPGKAATDRVKRGVKRQRLALEASIDPGAWQDVGAHEDVPNMDQCSELSEKHEVSTQTTTVTKCDQGTRCNITSANFTLAQFVNDPEGIHFYTGLETYDRLKFVLHTLGPADDLQYFQGNKPPLSVEDQFLLTLIKLRLHKTNFELSRMFQLTESMVMNTFITWINFMYVAWTEVPWWTSRDLVRYYAPTDFRAKFPKTRVIVDGTECPIQKPKQPLVQQATFSTYKNRNTAKVLLGCSPGGLVTFCSDAYGGSASDRQIVERSKLMNMCDPGDSIMADKGFNVQDLFAASKITINIPTFFKKTNRLTGEVVIKDRKIASKRVHVERIIGLGKTYKIIREPLNNTESNLATEIITVCYYLCNFRTGIVPQDA